MKKIPLSTHWTSVKKVHHQNEILPTEQARWVALINDTDHFALDTNALKYGPLSIAGYMHAMAHNPKTSYSSKWIMHPEQIANLFIICNIKVDEIVPTLVKHFIENRNSGKKNLPSPEASLFVIQRLILQKMGLDPTPNDAILLTSSVRRICNAMRFQEDGTILALMPFCNSPQDQTALVSFLAKTTDGKTSRFGKDSYLTALAHYFPQADVEIFAGLCVTHNDYEALSFLVAQDRLKLRQWVTMIVDSVGRSVANAKAYGVRDNINTTFILLSQSCAPQEWLLAIAQNRIDIPDLTEIILSMGPSPRDDIDGWLAWGGLWAANGLCDIKHPILQAQIGEAKEQIKRHLDHNDDFLLPSVRDTTVLTPEWFMHSDNPLLKLDATISNLAAQRFLLGWVAPNASSKEGVLISSCWMKNADISEALHFRWDQSRWSH
jgi:hypothetical protein